jgi:tRNA-dihydrouridine synthase 3
MDSAMMDSGDKPEAVPTQPIPVADMPLDSSGANSGDGEAKKRVRTSSPGTEAAEGSAKRQKGVAPIKAESVTFVAVGLPKY